MRPVLKINAPILARVESRQFGLSDPCVICGRKFNSPECPHSIEDTEPVIKRVKKMSKDEKDRVRSGAQG